MWRGQGRAEAGRVAASNQLHFRSVHSCLDFDAVFQHGFREGYSSIPKLQTRLSIFTLNPSLQLLFFPGTGFLQRWRSCGVKGK